MKKILVAIPARLASTRLSRKALADINGKPMVVHVVERALESRVGDIIVTTDSKEIENVVRKQFKENVDVVIVDNPEIRTGTDRIVEALASYDKKHQYDIVVNLQGDQPVMKPSYIRKCADIISTHDFDVGTLVSFCTDLKRKNLASVVKTIIVRSGQIWESVYFSRSPVPYGCDWFYHHLGIYSFKRSVLDKIYWNGLKQRENEQAENLEGLRFIENGIKIGTEVVGEDVISVDTQEDLENVRHILKQKFELNRRSF